jgi:hypothetical protein
MPLELIELERHARVLKMGALRVLFSYADPIAFVDARGTVHRLEGGLTKASRAHLVGWLDAQLVGATALPIESFKLELALALAAQFPNL